jgi:hypothetical protein
VTSKSPSGTVQVQRQHKLLILGLMVATLLPVLTACTASERHPARPAGSATSNPYYQFDQDVAQLLERQAVWQAPKRINVDSTARVGLVIGDPSLLKTEISQLVPGSYPVPAGSVKVGSTIAVQLIADPSDASVTPSAAIDNSIGEHTALLWTWYVYATHPNTSPGLFLTAEITTQMSDGHVLQEELALTIPVNRTLQYTAYQIFTNWATWAAIVGACAGLFAWIRKKRKKQENEQPPSSQIKTPEAS